jgi:thioredoxin 1
VGNAREFTDDNFESEVLKSSQPVLVDFWATWCSPCRQIAPVIDQLAGDYAGSVKVGKIDVDANQSIPMQYGIQNIPTLLLFKNGQVVERMMGVQPKSKLQAVLDAHKSA